MKCPECKRDLNKAVHAPACDSRDMFSGVYADQMTGGTLDLGAIANMNPARVYDFLDDKENK